MADQYKTIHTSTTKMSSTIIEHDNKLKNAAARGWEPEGGHSALFAENCYQLVTLLCYETEEENV